MGVRVLLLGNWVAVVGQLARVRQDVEGAIHSPHREAGGPDAPDDLGVDVYVGDYGPNEAEKHVDLGSALVLQVFEFELGEVHETAVALHDDEGRCVDEVALLADAIHYGLDQSVARASWNEAQCRLIQELLPVIASSRQDPLDNFMDQAIARYCHYAIILADMQLGLHDFLSVIPVLSFSHFNFQILSVLEEFVGLLPDTRRQTSTSKRINEDKYAPLPRQLVHNVHVAIDGRNLRESHIPLRRHFFARTDELKMVEHPGIWLDLFLSAAAEAR